VFFFFPQTPPKNTHHNHPFYVKEFSEKST
jgi:hypothetical protein